MWKPTILEFRERTVLIFSSILVQSRDHIGASFQRLLQHTDLSYNYQVFHILLSLCLHATDPRSTLNLHTSIPSLFSRHSSLTQSGLKRLIPCVFVPLTCDPPCTSLTPKCLGHHLGGSPTGSSREITNSLLSKMMSHGQKQLSSPTLPHLLKNCYFTPET